MGGAVDLRVARRPHLIVPHINDPGLPPGVADYQHSYLALFLELLQLEYQLRKPSGSQMLLSSCLFSLCLTWTAALPSPRSADCIPDPAAAPYGLAQKEYSSIYTAVQQAYTRVIDAGCSVETLKQLSNCHLKNLEDAMPFVLHERESCNHELTHQTAKLRQTLQAYGCVEPDRPGQDVTTSQTVVMFNNLETSLSSSTMCSALIKAGRRAFEDATLGQSSLPGMQKTAGHLPTSGSHGNAESQDNGKGEQTHQAHSEGPSLWAALIAGALAGLAVDLSLFPLDTIKTRLQSSAGFRASGGFVGLYQGIGSIALGSAPSSALFFLAYEFAGKKLTQSIGETFLGHLLATTIGEIAASLVRVPADVVKSRQQVDNLGPMAKQATLVEAIKKVYEEGSRPNSRSRFGVFYTGWLSNLVREIPFGCIQFPLFSYLKSVASARLGTDDLSLTAIAFCGMLAGACAGSLTTPLDVVKTRIMLAEGGESGILAVSRRILKEGGLPGLFRGVIPRTLWISLGGAIFLGGYALFTGVIDNFRAGIA